ncbi:type II secretion system protein N [Reinekea marinisedimentorum]|uniref:General secretion pathway protein C n=1 Tax=Reinekea marinisedimentorum TaxID=230495 RepID=A0A4V2UJY7_9GAMM|nr:type II secretion system protein N [Reinekea marinisedimentorum]TCS42079.1 general secretion pathway protein C [Reinekea marinisedimentorum]
MNKDALFKLWPKAQAPLIVLAVIFCGVTLAKATWLIIAPAPAVSVPAIKPAKASSSAQNGEDWVQISSVVSRRAFFGEEVTVAQEEKATSIEAPETSLNLSLLAILAGADGTGYAIIGEAKSTGKVFRVGDDVYGKAELQAVYGDRVIIDRNGKLETLRYEKLKSTELLKAVTGEDDSDSIEGASSLSEVMSRANRAVAEGGDMAAEVQGVMGYVAERANADPEAFIAELGLEVTDQGYQVSRKARQLQMVGLRPGDVINSVNDVPVGDVSTDQALLNQIMDTGGELKIQITRGSRSLTIYQTIPTN